MAQSKVNPKENVPLGQKKGKSASKGQRFAQGNMFDHIADSDGNPKTAKEFDDIPHAEDEVFFVLDDELTGDERKFARNRVDLLNYVHKELFYVKIARQVPAPAENILNKDTEIFHQGEYKGRKIDVGVHFYKGDNGVYTARAFVKFADATLDSDEYGLTIWADHAANSSEAKKDKAAKKIISGLTKFYWVPRWAFVVQSLRARMNQYSSDGANAVEIIEPEPAKSGGDDDDGDDGTEVELEVQVPSGCTGAIIGTKGAKINEIKSQSGVKDIKMPERVEPRPKPREMVTITIIGRKGPSKKADELIQAIAHEWLTAPRTPRDGNAGGGGGFEQASTGFTQPAEGFGSGEDTSNNNAEAGGAGGDTNWAESMNSGGGGW